MKEKLESVLIVASVILVFIYVLGILGIVDISPTGSLNFTVLMPVTYIMSLLIAMFWHALSDD